MVERLNELSEALAGAVAAADAGVVRVDGGCRGATSGFVFGTNGLVLTTAHGIDGESALEVGFSDGESTSAALVGRDASTDIALLRVGRNDTSPFRPADDTKLRRGELVLALARPGRGVRVALGVVSALGDEYRTGRGGSVERYIEPSLLAAAPHSGGPLLDAKGELVGMNTSGIARGTFLTLPHRTLARVAALLLEHGSVRRGFLGVSVHPVRLPKTLAAAVAQPYGLVVVGLEPGGAAERDGVSIGDVLLSLEGTPLASIPDLAAALANRSDQPTRLVLARGGASVELSVTPGARRSRRG
jgi:S1-C subfamily serine protease